MVDQGQACFGLDRDYSKSIPLRRKILASPVEIRDSQGAIPLAHQSWRSESFQPRRVTDPNARPAPRHWPILLWNANRDREPGFERWASLVVKGKIQELSREGREQPLEDRLRIGYRRRGQKTRRWKHLNAISLARDTMTLQVEPSIPTQMKATRNANNHWVFRLPGFAARACSRSSSWMRELWARRGQCRPRKR